MSNAALKLMEQLSQLPPADRLALAHFLWESLDHDADLSIDPNDEEPECDDALIADLNRREAEVLAGTAKVWPGSEVMDELRPRTEITDSLQLKRREQLAEKFISGNWGVDLVGFEAGQVIDAQADVQNAQSRRG